MDLRGVRATETIAAARPAIAARDIPAALINHEDADAGKLSLLDEAETLTNPLFLLVEPGRNPEIATSTAQLRAKLTSLGRTPEYLELEPGVSAARPIARAAVYRKIEEYLNLRLNHYAVKIGPPTEIK